MKQFDVQFTTTIDGIITIEARSAASAKKIASALLEDSLLLSSNVSYIDARSDINFITDTEEKLHATSQN